MTQIYSDGEHYRCSSCGRHWSRKHKFPWLPVRLILRHLFRKRPQGWSKGFYSVHYWHVGYADVGVHVYQRVMRIGKLIILTGPDKVDFPLEFVPEADGWFPKDQAERLKQHYRREREVDEIAERYGSKL